MRKEEVEIFVLSPEQLKFLIHNEEFEDELSYTLKRIKDIFVFGCTTELRHSDIFALTNKNFEKQEDVWYLKLKSKKTKTYSLIRLPNYAIEIYKKYKPKNAREKVFRNITLFNFNKNLKKLGEQAGFTKRVSVSR